MKECENENRKELNKNQKTIFDCMKELPTVSWEIGKKMEKTY